MVSLLQSEGIILKKFYLTNSNILAIYPKGKERCRPDKHSLKCDFDIVLGENANDNLDFMVNLNLLINEEEKPGFFIEIGSVGEFSLKNSSKLDERKQNQFFLFTALPMLINGVRVQLKVLTSMYENEPYNLPAIDLGDLINKKYSV